MHLQKTTGGIKVDLASNKEITTMAGEISRAVKNKRALIVMAETEETTEMEEASKDKVAKAITGVKAERIGEILNAIKVVEVKAAKAETITAKTITVLMPDLVQMQVPEAIGCHGKLNMM
jgi:hypothetical protein